MDQLALFFANDISSSEGVNTKEKSYKSKHTNQSGEIVFTKALHKPAIFKNNSLPCVASAQVSSILTQSHSYSVSGNLPLDLPPEPEEGNIEYKLKLINPTADRLEHLMTQLKWRLNEGGGQAIYRLGVDDCGAVTGLTAREMSASLSAFYKMAEKLGVDIRLLRECTISSPDGNPSLSPQRKAIELQAKWKVSVNHGIPDMRVAMLGSVDVGKSTLLGILTEGIMDDGRGRARLNIFCHLHEVQSGRTSSLSSEVIGFDNFGRLINRRRSKGQLNRRTIDEVIRDSNRLITVIDLAGHCKYQRTTLAGLTTYQPAFCLLVVSAITGLSPDGLSHARTAATLGLPIAVVLSKIDLLLNAPKTGPHRKISVASAADFNDGEVAYNSAVTELRKNVIEELKTIKVYCSNSDATCVESSGLSCFSEDLPVFPVSCVSGYGVNDLLNFLHEVSDPYQKILEPSPVLRTPPFCDVTANSALGEEYVECWVTRVFNNVPGVGNPILEILVRTGQVHNNQRLWLGPDEEGTFCPIRVVELRHNRYPHHVLFKDQIGSLLAACESTMSEDSDNFPTLRRGMVLINARPSRHGHLPSIAVCWSFAISNLVWIAPGTNGACLQPNSSVGIHTGNVMQYARVLKSTLTSAELTNTVDYFKEISDSSILRLDSCHRLIVAFFRHPEFLELGRQVVVSLNNVASVVGTIAGFEMVVTKFAELDLRLSSASTDDLCTNSSYSSGISSASQWHDISDFLIEHTSYETLLSQIGIDPTGPRTHFIGEPPPSPESTAQADASTQHQTRKRRQRTAKKRRKADARLALMNSMASLQSSVCTLNSCDNSSVCSLQKEEDATMEILDNQTKTPITSGHKRRRKRKRKRK